MHKNKDIWFTVRFKVNELIKFERNLKNQNFNYYIPRFTKRLSDHKTKTLALFPGYGFVKGNNENIGSLKYTRGLIDILKFGNSYASIDNETIEDVRKIEKSTALKPIDKNLKIGDEISIKTGPFKDYISKVISMPAKDRVTVLLSLLGSDKNIVLPTHLVEKT